MSMEPTFVALLQVRCPRVYPVAAPVNTERPYITWQHIGGQSLRFVDNTAADKRHTMVQVNVWHSTLASAFALMRQLEEDLCASTAMQAWPRDGDGQAACLAVGALCHRAGCAADGGALAAPCLAARGTRARSAGDLRQDRRRRGRATAASSQRAPPSRGRRVVAAAVARG